MALRIEGFEVEVTVRRPQRTADRPATLSSGEQARGAIGTPSVANGHAHGPGGRVRRAETTATNRLLGRASVPAPLQPANFIGTPEVTAGTPRFIAPPIQAPDPKPLPRGVTPTQSDAIATWFKPMFKRLSPLKREMPGNAELGTSLNAAGGGRPLDEATRNQMADVFGVDLGDVRVHEDQRAARLASELHAEAFTIGRNIYFGDGKFDPSSSEGRGLLAHELTHVVQQKGLPRPRVQGFDGGIGERALEAEANAVRKAMLATPDGFRGEQLTIERYTCTYRPNRPPSASDRASLERIASLALTVSEHILSSRPEMPSLATPPIETIAVDLDLSLVAMNDEEAARVWGRTIADAILRAARTTVTSATPAVGLVQRQAAPPAADQKSKIAKALQSGQFLDVADIDDLSQATDEEKVALSRICISGGYVAPQDASAKVHVLWSSMGERLPSVAVGHEAEWNAATRFSPRLMLLKPVVDSQSAFQAALRGFAEANLKSNEDFIEERKKRLGLTENDPLAPQQQAELRHSIQGMAWHAWELRQEQAKHRQIVVGYEAQDLGFGRHESKFDPGRPPKVSATLFSTPPAKWEDVKSGWDDAEDEIARIGNDYPELYNASIGDGAALLDLSRIVPERFGEKVKEQLLQLATRIQEVRAMIADGRLNLLQFGLLHSAVFKGVQASPDRDWTKGFDRWAAQRLIDQHKEREQAIKSLLTSVEVTALVVGTFTGGLGRLVAAGVAIGVEAFQAGQAAIEAQRLEKAATATPLTGTALVSKAQADKKRSEAIANMVKAVTNAILFGGPAIAQGLRAVRLRALVNDEALLARLKQLAGDEALLLDLLKKTGDPATLATLLERVPAARLSAFLERAGTTKLATSLTEKCSDFEQLGRLMDRVPDAAQLDQLLAGVARSDLAKLEEVLARIGEPGKGGLVFNVGGELEATSASVIINPGRQTMPIDRLRQLKPDNLVVEAGAARIPFPDSSGRLIVGNKLPNSIDWEAAAVEFKRVLAPGGRVQIAVYGPGAPLRQALTKQGFMVQKGTPDSFVVATRP